MGNDALTIRAERTETGLVTPLTAADMRAQVNLIQEVMRAVMKDGTHFGRLPGCGDRPTLLKPGAEKILATFRIAVEPIVEDLGNQDEAHYRVTARGVTMGNGTVVGCGIGECSSNEEKYKWRAAVCDEEYNETVETRRRMKWAKGRDGKPVQKKQVRTEFADIANTVLKMAKKRAQVDLCLTATAASDVFTQDIEDLPEELQHEVATQGTVAQPPADRTAAIAARVSKPATKTTTTPFDGGAKDDLPHRGSPPAREPNSEAQLDNTFEGEVESFSLKRDTKNDPPKWIKFGFKIGGVWYGTFDAKIGDVADAAHQCEPRGRVRGTWEQDGEYRTAKTIEEVKP